MYLYLKQRAIIPNDGGLPDNDACPVVQQDALPDPSRWMDIDRVHFAHAALERECKHALAAAPQRMRDTMYLGGGCPGRD